MSIFDVQHQPRALRSIQRSLASRRMPHAYLFAGPEGVGREKTALGLAQTLLCAQPVNRQFTAEGGALRDGLDACGQCQDCKLVLSGTHPDLIVVYRHLNRQHPDSEVRKQKAAFLNVEVIRHFLVERAGTYPSRGRARIFIVREAERMNAHAENALLKTLEEPPASTFLILLATSVDRMLPTTQSRCQHVQFQPLPDSFVSQRGGELRPQAPREEVEYVARHSGGSLGAALRQIDDGLFAMKKQWGERLRELAAARAGFAPHALAKPLEADARQLGKAVAERDPDVSDTDAARAGVRQLLAVLGDFYVDALRRASGSNLPTINTDQPEVIAALAAGYTQAGLVAALRKLQQADSSITRNAAIELTLEALFIELARAARIADPVTS